MLNTNLKIIFIILSFLLFVSLIIKIKNIKENFTEQSEPKKALLSSEPIMVLFYEEVDLKEKDKKKLDENEKINVKNKEYQNNFDKESSKSSVKFFKFNTKDPEVINNWTNRVPLEMGAGPVIRFYRNPGKGAGQDGMETLEVYKWEDILEFLKKK